MSLLEQEIFSQPEIIEQLLKNELQHIEQIVDELPAFGYILIAARGSSDHAATYAKYAWATHGHYPIALAAPSLHTIYQEPPNIKNALVVGISQSGQSPDIVAVLEDGRHQGCPTIAITNDGNSPLAAAADYVVQLHAGLEKSIIATKTYTAQLAVMMMFAAAWSGNRQHLNDLQQIPGAIAAALNSSAEIAQRAERYRYIQECVVIGRGYNTSTALELGLKLKELTYIVAPSYSSADFRHGPISTISQGLPTILIMPAGTVLDDMINLAEELRQRQAELLIISDTPQALKYARTAFPLSASVPEWISPITAIIPGQLLSLHLAQVRGLDPDLPRGSNKTRRTD